MDFRFKNALLFKSLAAISFLIFCIGIIPDFFHQQYFKISRSISIMIEISELFLVVIVLKNYFSLSKKYKKLYVWLILALIGLVLDRASFFVVVYIQKIPIDHISIREFLIYCLPFLGWLLCITKFFWDLFEIKKKTFMMKKFFLLIFFNVLILTLFLISLKNAQSSNFWVSLITKYILIHKLFLFDLIILGMIYSKDSGFILFLSGVAAITASGTFLNYSALSGKYNLLIYSESTWLFGSFLMLFGFIYSKNEQYFDKEIGRNETIRSQISFWTFSFSITSFLIFFVAAYLSGFLEKNFLPIVPFFIMVYSIVTVISSLLIGKYFQSPFEKINKNIELLSKENNKNRIDTDFSAQEFSSLQNFITRSFEIKEQKDFEKRAFSKIVTQVAHDIRSPIAALNVGIKNLSQIPDEQKTLIKNASTRINDIANSLLKKYKSNNALLKIESDFEIALFFPVLNDIISEKMLQFEGAGIEFDEIITREGFFAFSKFNHKKIKRILSNLINNSIESFDENGGKVCFKLDASKEKIFFKIVDNGCGMSEEQLRNVLNFGASMKREGFGLGLSYAKEVIEEMHGQLKMYSTVMAGTTVEIVFPRESPPSWFVSEITLSRDAEVAIFDHDQSLYDALYHRLHLISSELKIHYFQSISSFESWCLNQSNEVQIFSDYEFLEGNGTRLDVLKGFSKNKNFILLISSYEDEAVLDGCKKLGVSALPRSLISHVPIKFHDEKEMKGVDFVLIDDSELLRESWEISSKSSGKNILTFASVSEFEEALPWIDRETVIYIDSNLEPLLKGEEYAKKLFYSYSFKKIHLVTGYPVSSFTEMPWLISIRDKMPPF